MDLLMEILRFDFPFIHILPSIADTVNVNELNEERDQLVSE
jgi:hypothetical protein